MFIVPGIIGGLASPVSEDGSLSSPSSFQRDLAPMYETFGQFVTDVVQKETGH